jgi:hypothetical protein
VWIRLEVPDKSEKKWNFKEIYEEYLRCHRRLGTAPLGDRPQQRTEKRHRALRGFFGASLS